LTSAAAGILEAGLSSCPSAVVIELAQGNSHLAGKLNKGNGEGPEGNDKQNGNSELMLKL
jgi:hypothetical protein